MNIKKPGDIVRLLFNSSSVLIKVYCALALMFCGPLGAIEGDSDNDMLVDSWESDNSRNPAVADFFVSAGWNTTCSKSDSGVTCWGDVSNGQNANIPSFSNLQELAVGASHVCGLDDNGVQCWGNPAYTSVPAMTGVTQISSFKNHTCALHDGGVSCWGDNTYGQTIVPVLTNPTQIAVGGGHSCALDGAIIICWGLNDHGQSNQKNGSSVSKLVAGDKHNCAIGGVTIGYVSCWGVDGKGQSSPDPFYRHSVLDISAGQNMSCALYKHNNINKVRCWGSDGLGQSSWSASTEQTTLLTSGYQHTCALDEDGVFCWGRDSEGQGSVPFAIFDDADDDNDLISDIWESNNGLNAVDNSDADLDPDSDGLSNYAEYRYGFDPFIVDSAVIARNDFDADGDDDLIFQDSDSGVISRWELQNGLKSTGSWWDQIPVVNQWWLSADFELVAYIDVDGDYDQDLVFHDGVTELVIWVMENGERVDTHYVEGPDGFPVVKAAKLSDATFDGMVFSNSEGNIITMRTGRYSFPSAYGHTAWIGAYAGYTHVASGDLDADGDDDLVLQDAVGNVVIIEIENIEKVTARWLGQWNGREVIGTGDADLDGDEDIFMANGGDISLIEMEDAQKVIGRWVGVWSGYEFQSLGDIDADGDVDLILQDSDSGAIAGIEIENAAKVVGRWLGNFNYDVKGGVDADADGDMDVVLQDGSGNVALIELENGAKVGGAKWLGVNSGEIRLF